MVKSIIYFSDWDSGKYLGTISVECSVVAVTNRKHEFLNQFDKSQKPYPKGKSKLNQFCRYLNNNKCKCKVLKRKIETHAIQSL